jgi:DNA-directed RNA polymerase specialized sigma54-like protein
MQLLEFNSTDKTVVLKSGFVSWDVIIKFDNVPTVKVENGYYEVMQRIDGTSAVPVLRVPIANTNMLIQK